MNCSTELLYRDYGQYDYTVNVYFYQGTESYKRFGKYVTGVLYYTQKERISLENNLKPDPVPTNDGLVKFRVLSYDYDKELKKTLLDEGFMASHVAAVDTYMKPTENKFTEKATRKLAEPLFIEVQGGSDEEGERLMMGLYSSMTERGNKLTPFERNEYSGYIYKYYKEKVPDEVIKADFSDPKTGEIKVEIMYHALRSGYNANKLTEHDTKRFEEIVGRFQDEKHALLKKELNGTQESL